jgi:hypothetical protein
MSLDDIHDFVSFWLGLALFGAAMGLTGGKAIVLMKKTRRKLVA